MPTETFQIGSDLRNLSVTAIISIKNCYLEQFCSHRCLHSRSKIFYLLRIEAFNRYNRKIRAVGNCFESKSSSEA